MHEALQAAAGAEDMLHKAFLATDETISAEEGCTATAVLMWRDGSGAVCLQVRAWLVGACWGLELHAASLAARMCLPLP